MVDAVAVRDLVVVLGGRRILHGLTFRAPAGRVTGLLGPSGCGKTTLMRCVVGVQQIDGGAVTVLDEPAGTAALRARVGYVTQAASVYGDLTVRENVRYFAAVYGVTLLVNVGVNAGALRLLDVAWQVEIAFLCAQACSTTLNFVAMRHLVFVPRHA